MDRTEQSKKEKPKDSVGNELSFGSCPVVFKGNPKGGWWSL